MIETGFEHPSTFLATRGLWSGLYFKLYCKSFTITDTCLYFWLKDRM